MLNTGKLEFSLAYWIDSKSVIFSSPFIVQSALLSTQIIYPNLHVIHPHRRSTTNPLFPFTSVLNVTVFRTTYQTTKYIYVCPVMVFISLLLSQREIENPLLLFHLLVDAIFVAVFINLLSDEWDMYSLMFHENLPKLNLGHFWPGSLSYDQGCTRVPGYL